MNLCFILILLLIVFILLKIPVSLAIAGATLISFIIGGYPVYLLVQGIIRGSSAISLLAVPLFILVGNLCNEVGITEKIFDFVNGLTGHIKGGLAHANILASIVFAGVSGTVVADVAGLGIIELEAMDKAGYDKELSAGITGASAIVGPIIPPSLPFLMYAFIAEISVARLFLCGLFPGVVIGLVLMITVYIMEITGIYKCPTGKKITTKEIIRRTFKAVPGLLAPIILLIGFTTGLVTPTESGLIGSLYAIIIGIAYKKLTFVGFMNSLKRTLMSSAHVIFILGVSSAMGYLLTIERAPYILADFMLSLTTNVHLILAMTLLLCLIIGCFMSYSAALVILAPILIPVMRTLGVDLYHFGVILVLALSMGAVTPPVGVALYILTDITKLPIEKVVKGHVPFLISLIIALLIITYIPQVVLWLPRLIMK